MKYQLTDGTKHWEEEARERAKEKAEAIEKRRRVERLLDLAGDSLCGDPNCWEMGTWLAERLDDTLLELQEIVRTLDSLCFQAPDANYLNLRTRINKIIERPFEE